jgi:hypothetical protein
MRPHSRGAQSPCEEGGGVRGPEEGGRRGRARVALCRRAADVAAPGSAPSVATTLPGIEDNQIDYPRSVRLACQRAGRLSAAPGRRVRIKPSAAWPIRPPRW